MRRQNAGSPESQLLAQLLQQQAQQQPQQYQPYAQQYRPQPQALSAAPKPKARPRGNRAAWLIVIGLIAVIVWQGPRLPISIQWQPTEKSGSMAIPKAEAGQSLTGEFIDRAGEGKSWQTADGLSISRKRDGLRVERLDETGKTVWFAEDLDGDGTVETAGEPADPVYRPFAENRNYWQMRFDAAMGGGVKND